MSDTTPVTVPGKPTRLESVDGIPNQVEYERTGEVARTLYSAAENSSGTAEAFLESLAEKLKGDGNGGDGGIPPDKHAKSLKRHNWITTLVVLLLGPGGAFAVIYATNDRSKSNTEDVKAMKPRVEKAESDVRIIRVRIGDMQGSMNGIKTQQTVIAEGIEDLKKENVTRLQQELKDAKRELRRRDRFDDD